MAGKGQAFESVTLGHIRSHDCRALLGHSVLAWYVRAVGTEELMFDRIGGRLPIKRHPWRPPSP
jgi:hypothetical protein